MFGAGAKCFSGYRQIKKSTLDCHHLKGFNFSVLKNVQKFCLTVAKNILKNAEHLSSIFKHTQLKIYS